MKNLRETLDSLCSISIKPVPRWMAAEKMGLPGSATENMISAALKLDEFKARYGIRNGRYGGVILLDVPDDGVLGLDAPLVSTDNTFDSTIPSIPVSTSSQSEAVSAVGV